MTDNYLKMVTALWGLVLERTHSCVQLGEGREEMMGMVYVTSFSVA